MFEINFIVDYSKLFEKKNRLNRTILDIGCIDVDDVFWFGLFLKFESAEKFDELVDGVCDQRTKACSSELQCLPRRPAPVLCPVRSWYALPL